MRPRLQRGGGGDTRMMLGLKRCRAGATTSSNAACAAESPASPAFPPHHPSSPSDRRAGHHSHP